MNFLKQFLNKNEINVWIFKFGYNGKKMALVRYNSLTI